MIKFGLIGAGRSAKRLIKATQSINTGEIIAVAAKTYEEAEEFGKTYSIPHICKEYQEMLTMEDIDVIIVSVPHNLHYPIIKEIIPSGKNIICEKPFTINVSKGEELIELAKNEGIKIGVFFQKRFTDASLKAKELIEEGKLGKILHAQVNVFWDRDQEYYDASSWRGSIECEGGGTLINQSIHIVDLLIWLLGDPTKVFGMFGTKTHTIEVEDNAVALLILQDNVYATIQTSTSVPLDYPATLKIFGSEGMLSINGYTLSHTDKNGEMETFPEGKVAQLSIDEFKNLSRTRLFTNFIEALTEDKEIKIDANEGLRAVRVIKSIYKSNGKDIIS